MTDMFEQGAKSIIRGPLHAYTPQGGLTPDQMADFAAGMQFAARVQLILDLMKPEPRQPVPDMKPGPHGWIVKRIGNPGAVILYADNPDDAAKVKEYAADPDYKVTTFFYGQEVSA